MHWGGFWYDPPYSTHWISSREIKCHFFFAVINEKLGSFFLYWIGIKGCGKHLFLIAAESLQIHVRNIQVTCNVQNSGFACDFFPPEKFNSQALLSLRYQIKRCLIAGVILIQHSFTDISFRFRYYVLFINTE